MRKRKNTPDVTEELTELEQPDNEQELAEEDFEKDEENEVAEPIVIKDDSLPAKLERFTQREDLGSKKKISLKDILGGEILTGSTFRKQLGLIAICVFYIIVYITNRYQAQQELIEIEEQKYYSLTRSGEFTIKSRQSQVEKMLKQTPDSMLATPSEPPFIIKTTTEEE